MGVRFGNACQTPSPAQSLSVLGHNERRGDRDLVGPRIRDNDIGRQALRLAFAESVSNTDKAETAA